MQRLVIDLKVAFFRLTECCFLSILRIAHDKVSICITSNGIFNVAQNIPVHGIYLRHGIGAKFNIFKYRFSICSGYGSYRYLISIIRFTFQNKGNTLQVWFCAVVQKTPFVEFEVTVNARRIFYNEFFAFFVECSIHIHRTIGSNFYREHMRIQLIIVR